ncbi:MAG: MBL fold metallo-hydrolase [Chloroflexales bacterium]|nr:MBL fold metallo-hydrolase [Chloroflexales bacterium]
MSQPTWLHFFQRTFPSANMILVQGSSPVLIDTGFGSDLAATEQLLAEAGTPPERLSLIVNTHYHSDHVGGNSGLQRKYGLAIATHWWDADLINRRDRDACAAEWLDQPIEPYQVDRPLADGDEIDAGGVSLQVIHAPGHTTGQICLYAPTERVLICGDTVHGDDVAWLNLFREGEDALKQAIQSIEQLAALPIQLAFSGHGPAISDPPRAFDTALRRYRKWQEEPEKIAWHACKRIFTYHLMLKNGMLDGEIAPYLQGCGWFNDYSRAVFQVEPADFVQPLLAELLRSRAAAWQGGRLVPLGAYNPPPSGWPAGPAHPQHWPRLPYDLRKDEGPDQN